MYHFQHSIGLYELSRKNLFVQKNFFDHFCAGALAGTIAAIATVPFDVIKTRQQMTVLDTETSTISDRKSFLRCGFHVYKAEGITAFFKGTFPRAARVAPACAIMISSYELVKKKLRERKINQKNTTENNR